MVVSSAKFHTVHVHEHVFFAEFHSKVMQGIFSFEIQKPTFTM